MGNAILILDNVSKYFRSHWTFQRIKAVQNVSLEVVEGEAFGFLGHNGAGKTTTMKCIVGLLRKNGGRILLDGKEVVSAGQRSILGYLPEFPYFYDHLTVEETLDLFATLHGLKNPERRSRVTATLERVGLDARRKSPVRALSKGLQQRLGFAQAIINQPRLLLLDEPFSGFDPLGRLEFRKLILDLRRQGTTIFLSSHILSDVEDICDRVSIMSQGEIKKVFSLRETGELFGEAFEIAFRCNKEADTTTLVQQLAAKAEEYRTEHLSQGVIHTLRFHDYELARSCVAIGLQHGLLLDSFRNCGLHLEDVFIKITRESGDHRGPVPPYTSAGVNDSEQNERRPAAHPSAAHLPSVS